MLEALSRVSAVPITPFDADGAIDEASLAGVVSHMVGHGIPVVVPCGGTGEFSALTPAERDRVVRLTLEAAGDAVVLAGVGGDASSAARAAAAATAAGAAGVMIHALTDPYLTSEGIVRYVEQVGASCDGVLVPYLRGRLPAPEALEQIVALEQVVAVKWAIPDLQGFAGFVERFGQAALPMCGLAELWAPYFALAGGRGFTSGLVNVDPLRPLALSAALLGGAWGEAMDLWRAVRPFEELRARHDSGNNVPAVKEAAALAGLIATSTVRPPLAPLSVDDRAELAAIVRELLPTLP